ncbi:MAG: transcriptional antiterminator Rof (Rho-off) [Maribacter sp.]|jgi:transcriptional antiterminator Rof (Rho-off)
MNENIKFIEGHFSPAEAADLLLSLLNDKIKFHTVKALNLRQGEKDSVCSSTERISSLKEAKKRVEELVVAAHKNGMELKIDSSIAISLVAILKS